MSCIDIDNNARDEYVYNLLKSSGGDTNGRMKLPSNFCQICMPTRHNNMTVSMSFIAAPTDTSETNDDAVKRSSKLYRVSYTLPKNTDTHSDQHVEGEEFFSCNSNVVYNDEQELLRERLRTSVKGISTIIYSADAKKALVPCGRHIFCCDDLCSSSASWRALNVEDAMDCQWSPDARYFAFVRKSNLNVFDMKSGEHRQLTDVKGSVKAGVADFIMQEEFNRHTGYWWCPTVTTVDSICTYRILLTQVDSSKVPIVHVAPTSLHGSRLQSYSYPRPGQTNATSVMRVITLTCDQEQALSSIDVCIRLLSIPIAIQFPWCEYIVRAGWTKNPQQFFVRLLDRQQQFLIIVLYTISPHTIAGTVIHEERSSTWINVTHLCIFLDDSLLVSSEQDNGFCHIVRVSLDTNETQPVTGPGDWRVHDGKMWIDTTNHRLFFVGTRDTHLERHLYSVDYIVGVSTLRRLTPLGFNHNVTMLDDECTRFVSVFSSLRHEPRTIIYYINDNQQVIVEANIERTSSGCFETYLPLVPHLCKVTSTDGNVQLDVAVYPPNTQVASSSLLPTVILCYGGPEVQLVSNDFSLSVNAKARMLQQHGMLVAIIDGRGSAHRGRMFEGHLHLRLGQVEVQDQVELVQLLVNEYNADPSRIAIHGWSYGGYLSLMCLAQRPDVFKIAVAGAPVVMWEAYDTGYTERYMNTPQNNPEGYRRGCVNTYAKYFPSEPNRLVICHGLQDENVHFIHTSSLISALIIQSKPYLLQVFPEERHGLRAQPTSLYFHRYLLEFLITHL